MLFVCKIIELWKTLLLNTDVCERVWIGATSIFHLSFMYICIIQNHDRYYEWACVSSIFTLSFNHKHHHFCSVFAILHCSYFIFYYFLFVDDHHGIEFPLFKYFRKKLRKTQTERKRKKRAVPIAQENDEWQLKWGNK